MDPNYTGGWEYAAVSTNDPGIIDEYARQGWELLSVTRAPASFGQPDKTIAANRLDRRTISLLLIALGVIVLLCLFFTLVPPKTTNNSIALSQVASDVVAGKVAKIVVHEESNEIQVQENPPQTGPQFTSVKEPNSDLSKQLQDLGVPSDKISKVEISVEKASSWGQYVGLLGFCGPTLVLLGGFALLAWELARFSRNARTLFIFRRPQSAAQNVAP
jgi:ATP-dependent Zn protease